MHEMPRCSVRTMRQSVGALPLKLLVLLFGLTLAGCFGPWAMQRSLVAYDSRNVQGEEDLLLLNIARVARSQPPHFMLLTEVNESVTFTGTGGFEIGAGGPASLTEAGPFAATGTENPLFKFLPIQGQDFANRFESPLTDKFIYFLQEEQVAALTRRVGDRGKMVLPSAPSEKIEATKTKFSDLLELTSRGLWLTHGNADYKADWYPNEAAAQDKRKTFVKFTKALDSNENLYVEQIEGGQEIAATTSSHPPATADLIAALQAGYRWKQKGQDFVLVKTFRMPALVNFDIAATQANVPTPGGRQSLELPAAAQTKATELVAALAAGYGWQTKDRGYLLAPLNVATLPSVGVPSYQQRNLPNADQIVSAVQPFPQDYVYVELRGLNANGSCDDGKTLCGYLAIGTFMATMRRLAEDAAAKSPQDVIGIGEKVPSGVDRSICLDSSTSVWVPFHSRPDLANHDREMFVLLYKLYQMSLVDTSKLMTTTPITIGK